ncbi:hypothetical protein [Breznakiella homolactica]|uniref:Alcohol acetyltransferase n=1 Tax=Breznakiella homolactica TaxID=2798577 RepID=A0A7T8BA13_9SPIR|nr:hypothetical protein [Breznakiella homolactica]QQO09062.1 hypothetical protein JFL75_19360 [Breznakiella homolactica]
MEYNREWSRLDNAAKIFPPTTTRGDTKVFRFACELYETVDPAVLQNALDHTMEKFPFYRSILRRGVFWYYFEDSKFIPIVREENKPPCAPLYDADHKSLLFEVTYYRKRINLEIYHALADGTGALQFLKTLVYYYLLEKHKDTIDSDVVMHDYDASDEQKRRDAFDKYYSAQKLGQIQKRPRAYYVRGERFPEYRLGVIEGCLSAKALIEKVREMGATVSEYLTSVLILSIHEGMTFRDEEKPVSVIIPVDLRRFFSSLSARNFFGTFNVSHNFQEDGAGFENVLAQVKRSFKEQLAPEKISRRLNQFSALEHRMFIKVVPLFIKAPVLKFSAWKVEKEDTAVFSNIGKITMPPELSPYIRLFDLFNSSKRPHLCVCSFEDNLVISFSSPFISSDIQRCFFRTLTGLGLEVEIVSNTTELRGEGA